MSIVNINIILLKILLLAFWFSISVYAYLNIIPNGSNIKRLINKLTFFELFLVLFTIYICVMFILNMVEDYIISIHLSNIDHINYFWGDANAGGSSDTTATESINTSNSSNTINSSQNTNSKVIQVDTAKFNPNTADFVSKAADGAIMSAAVSAGFKLAQASPTRHTPSTKWSKGIVDTGKAGAVCAGLGAGIAGILGKNIASSVSSEAGKQIKPFLPNSSDLIEKLETLFNLTGNNGLDLLNIILFFQKLQLFVTMLICYNLLLLLINEERVENFLIKIFPTKIVKLYIKSLRIFKKSGFIIIICLFIILLISNIYSHYFLDFFISNLDSIIKLYFSK